MQESFGIQDKETRNLEGELVVNYDTFRKAAAAGVRVWVRVRVRVRQPVPRDSCVILTMAL